MADLIGNCTIVTQSIYDTVKKNFGITTDTIFIRYLLKDILRAELDYTEFHSQIFSKLLGVKKEVKKIEKLKLIN